MRFSIAGKTASALRRQLDKIIEHDASMSRFERLFAQMASTKLSMLSAMVDFEYEHSVTCLDDFKRYMTPRVLRLVEILKGQCRMSVYSRGHSGGRGGVVVRVV